MKFTIRGLLFVLGGMLLWLTFSSPLSTIAARSLQNIWQLGHVLLFAIWTYLLFPVLSQRIQRPLLLFTILIFSTLLVGLLIEYLQTFVGREFSLKDLTYDLIGCLFTLSGFLFYKVLLMPKWPRQTLYAATGRCVFTLLPP